MSIDIEVWHKEDIAQNVPAEGGVRVEQSLGSNAVGDKKYNEKQDEEKEISQLKQNHTHTAYRHIPTTLRAEIGQGIVG